VVNVGIAGACLVPAKGAGALLDDHPPCVILRLWLIPELASPCPAPAQRSREKTAARPSTTRRSRASRAGPPSDRARVRWVGDPGAMAGTAPPGSRAAQGVAGVIVTRGTSFAWATTPPQVPTAGAGAWCRSGPSWGRRSSSITSGHDPDGYGRSGSRAAASSAAIPAWRGYASPRPVHTAASLETGWRVAHR
jgi:hypothetical protein